MQTASFESFADKVNSLKKNHRRLLSNIFLNAHELQEVMSKKACLFLGTSYSLFLLLPCHNKYYDLLFFSASLESLEDDLQSLLLDFKSINQPIRASITGKEPAVSELAVVFEICGFVLNKKLARMILQKKQGTVAQAVDEININADINADVDADVDVANKGDAQEILDLLLEEFDLIGDNVPELARIEENIEQRQVAVIRRDCRIAAMHYFEVKNGQCHQLFDVSRKEYRKDFLVWKFPGFSSSYLAKLDVPINRIFGWRDISNKRLLKIARMHNQVPDGVYISNMLWKPGR
jgi:hypothetical protein